MYQDYVSVSTCGDPIFNLQHPRHLHIEDVPCSVKNVKKKLIVQRLEFLIVDVYEMESKDYEFYKNLSLYRTYYNISVKLLLTLYLDL